MKLLDCRHESANAHTVVARGRSHHLLCPVVHRVELPDLVGEAYALEEGTNVFSAAWKLEVVFGDAELGEGRGEEQVNGLGLVAVVLKSWLQLKKFENLRCSRQLSASP